MCNASSPKRSLDLRADQYGMDFFTAICRAIPCGRGEHYCSDRSNPDLLWSIRPWCAEFLTGFVCKIQHQAGVRRRGNGNETSMKKALFVIAMLSLGTLCWAGSAREDATERLENATQVVHEIMGMPDKGIPEEVLEHAKCVAVVPHMVKGGFIFGAKEGKGVATCRTADGWSAPAFITISGGSWGLQIGVEAVDVVLIIQNDKGMQRLLSSNFQIGGDASAAAGPVGRHAEAGTDWKMDTEILTYSRAKGAFAGLTLEGASLRQDSDSRHAMYGGDVTTRALLLGEVPVPPAAQPFLAEIRGAKAQAKSEEKDKDKDKN
jgi:SH3 domain-containing YSC84-like protein 1